MQEKQLGVIVIPAWIKELLEAQGVSTAQIIHYDTVREALTFEHRVILLMAQDLRAGLFSAHDLQADSSTLTRHWFNTTTEYEHEVSTLTKEAHERVSAGFNLQQAVGLTGTTAPVPTDTVQPTLEVLPLDGTSLVGVVVYETLASIDVPTYYEVVQSLIEHFYTYETPYKVSAYRIFNTYLTLMARNRQVS